MAEISWVASQIDSLRKSTDTRLTFPLYDPNLMARRETMEFVRGYYKIRDPQSRKRIYELTKVLGAADG
jgi:hypothetical protein